MSEIQAADADHPYWFCDVTYSLAVLYEGGLRAARASFALLDVIEFSHPEHRRSLRSDFCHRTILAAARASRAVKQNQANKTLYV